MILHNRAKCAKCGYIIESRHQHDWVPCKCGAIFVDGGTAYLRRGGSPDDFIDLTEYTDEPA